VTQRPADLDIVTPTKSKAQKKREAGERLRQYAMRRGWRAPLHWEVPPTFICPGFAMEELGITEFKEACKRYYERIGEMNVAKAQRGYVKWAIRQVLRTFRLHVLGFHRQVVSKKGRIQMQGGNTVLQLPEVLRDEGRLMNDMNYILRCYGVPEENWDEAKKQIDFKVCAEWGIDPNGEEEE
jgi:hypothetical protein